MHSYLCIQATHPQASRATSTPAYLVLLRMEVTAFHRNSIRSSLWPCSSPHGVRPLADILLYGVRTFLSPLFRGTTGSDCLASFSDILSFQDGYDLHCVVQINMSGRQIFVLIERKITYVKAFPAGQPRSMSLICCNTCSSSSPASALKRSLDIK